MYDEHPLETGATLLEARPDPVLTVIAVELAAIFLVLVTIAFLVA